MDTPLRVRVRGLAPGSHVVVTAFTPFEPGRAFVGRADFVVRHDGTIDRSQQDAMSLLTSAVAEKAESMTSSFSPPEPFVVTIRAEVDGRTVAVQEITRRFIAENVKVVEVRKPDVVGRFFVPRGSRRRAAVIVLSGSEGGVTSSQITAGLLASHGYPALALAYFRDEGLNDQLIEIPVETVKRGIEWMQRRPEVDGTRIGCIGGSKGAELALVAASEFPEIRAVVAYAPSFVVWPGIRKDGRTGSESSWTLRGVPLPFVPHVAPPEFTSQFRNRPPYRLRPLYENSLRDEMAVAKAAIPVERINGPVLLISGGDDQMIPSHDMAKRIMQRLKDRQHPYRDRQSFVRGGRTSDFRSLPACSSAS